MREGVLYGAGESGLVCAAPILPCRRLPWLAPPTCVRDPQLVHEAQQGCTQRVVQAGALLDLLDGCLRVLPRQQVHDIVVACSSNQGLQRLLAWTRAAARMGHGGSELRSWLLGVHGR